MRVRPSKGHENVPGQDQPCRPTKSSRSCCSSHISRARPTSEAEASITYTAHTDIEREVGRNGHCDMPPFGLTHGLVLQSDERP